MNSFFYGFAHVCESFFNILPCIGPAVNVLFIAAGSIGTAVWIWYGIKNKADKGNYKA
jgi:hypothetical protein